MFTSPIQTIKFGAQIPAGISTEKIQVPAQRIGSKWTAESGEIFCSKLFFFFWNANKQRGKGGGREMRRGAEREAKRRGRRRRRTRRAARACSTIWNSAGTHRMCDGQPVKGHVTIWAPTKLPVETPVPIFPATTEDVHIAPTATQAAAATAPAKHCNSRPKSNFPSSSPPPFFLKKVNNLIFSQRITKH